MGKEKGPGYGDWVRIFFGIDMCTLYDLQSILTNHPTIALLYLLHFYGCRRRDRVI